jgi:hypothetical protein
MFGAVSLGEVDVRCWVINERTDQFKISKQIRVLHLAKVGEG